MTEHHTDTNPSSESDVATEQEYAQAPLFHVVMHNDDFTTMDFVVFVLMEVFNHDVDRAVTLMMDIHQKGQAIVATLPKEIGEMKIAVVQEHAEKAEYPLLVTLQRA